MKLIRYSPTKLMQGQIAKLVGVAPLICDSGLMRGNVTGSINRVRRTLPCCPANYSLRSGHETFFLRLKRQGKVALAAVIRRMLITLNIKNTRNKSNGLNY